MENLEEVLTYLDEEIEDLKEQIDTMFEIMGLMLKLMQENNVLTVVQDDDTITISRNKGIIK